MSVPEGYAVAPTTTDHMVKLAVPAGDEHILIEAPRLAWIAPYEVEDVDAWAEEMTSAERDVNDWHADKAAWDHYESDPEAWTAQNDSREVKDRLPVPMKPGSFPAKKAKLCGDRDPVRKRELMREMKLRWIKPYVSEDSYHALLTSTAIPERTITWLFDELNKPGDITPGESGASTAS